MTNSMVKYAMLSDADLKKLSGETIHDFFTIGKDNFADLEINSKPSLGSFYYFFNKKERRLIKRFVLLERKMVIYLCQVTLIKKGNKFSPRLEFSVRDKSSNILSQKIITEGQTKSLKANVSLTGCHENFWSLISFLQSLRNIEIPNEKFSLVSQNESEIVSALSGRDPASIIDIIKQLSQIQGAVLSKQDINLLLKRRDRLSEFEQGLKKGVADELKWQNFFENNKWIFGYGLNYQILRQEQSQPNYGGARIDGRGGQKGDYLTASSGDINFTVLVEIKTPVTPLLQGTHEIRNGAWSISKDLTDSISQIGANISTWDKVGSTLPENRDRLEEKKIYTVEPKGIIVAGSLSQLKIRSQWETFQRFRKSIHGIDIITFDELYNRAKFIVESK